MFENLIISNLIHNEQYARKVLPFIKDEYFQERDNLIVFKIVEDFIHSYAKLPTKEAILVELDSKTDISEDEYDGIRKNITQYEIDNNTDLAWLVDNTEKFCQDRAIYNAITKSISILDEKKTSQLKGSIPQLLSDALAVSFDNSVGHDFFSDYESRFEFYHRAESKIPFDLNYFNLITKGGLPPKTLNMILAGTGVGKSLFMCHAAAGNLMRGCNVLYITLEMAEERIAERIDANLLNINVNDLMGLSKDVYDKKVQRVKEKTTGKLIIKEYPTATAGAGHFRHLLNELKIKRKFVPDIIYVDYLNICVSSRIKQSSNVNSYTYIKAIAEELRGLAVEFNVALVSATQTTRSGYSNTDVGLEDTSESFGLPATADLMFALISSDELQSLNQIMVKQLKNRYNDPNIYKKFVIGVDKAKMKLYDVEQDAQNDIHDGGSAFDNTQSGNRISSEKKSKFEGFK